MPDRKAASASLAEDSVEDAQDSPYTYDPHIYDGERCINCNVNTYDDSIYGPFPCVPREPMRYSTETPGPTEPDHTNGSTT